jgi:Na+:H+ antiporter, NhaA family
MVKTGIANLPESGTWSHMIGVAFLAGIGFTMSLFISEFAFSNPLYIKQTKYGKLIASIIPGILAMLVLTSGRKSN